MVTTTNDVKELRTVGRPPINHLIYYPLRTGKNVVDLYGELYYYHELKQFGYSDFDLCMIKRVIT